MAKFDLLRRNFERVFRSDEQALPGYCSAALPGCCFAVSLPAARRQSSFFFSVQTNRRRRRRDATCLIEPMK